MNIFHWLAHKLHWNYGNVVSGTTKKGVTWVGFQCDGCGKISGVNYLDDSFFEMAVPPKAYKPRKKLASNRKPL